MDIVLRRVALCLVGLVVGLTTRAIAVNDAAFSFAGRSWIDMVLLLAAGWSIVISAIVIVVRRTHVPLACALAATGIAWFVAEWDNPRVDSSFIFTVGLSLGYLCPGAVTWVALLNPAGRLDGMLEWAIGLTATTSALALGVLPTTQFDPDRSGCASCPDNLIGMEVDGGAVLSLGRACLRAALVVIVITIVVLGWRLFQASSPRRRRQGPVVLACMAFLTASGWLYAINIDRGFVASGTAEHRLWIAQAFALVAIAAVVLVDPLRTRLVRSAVARIVVRLDQSSGEGRVRESFVRAIGDDDLEIVYPMDDAQHGEPTYADAQGQPVHPSGSARSSTSLIRSGHKVALLMHRPSLVVDPLVVEEVLDACSLILHHERLQAHLRAHERELKASRSRIVDAADSERRRLERDLHDGAQQRLVGVLMTARLAASRTGGDAGLVSAVDHIARETEAAIVELRSIAQGIHPAVLSDEGLSAAFESLAEGAPLEICCMTSARFPVAVEHAAYRVVAESVRCGPTRVTALDREGHLVIDIRTTSIPTALVELEDRAGAADGWIDLTESEDGDVLIHVELPCA